MPNRILQVEVVANAAQYERGMKKAQAASSSFGHQTEVLGKQVDSSRKSLEHFHKVAFGLGSLLVGGGLATGFKDLIDSARHAQESVDHLSVTMKDAGLNYEKVGKQVEGFIRKQSELAAFQQTDLRESFGTIIRMTKNTGTAMRDEALAANLARGRHIDLASATTIVIKAQEGMVGSLRRLGINIQPVKDAQNALIDSHKHFDTATKAAAKALDQQATALRAIDTLSKSYAGNAKAYGESSQGATDKFKVALQNLQITVGTVLLPELNKILVPMTAWLQKMSDSGKAAKFTKKAVDDLKTAMGVVKVVVGDVRDAFHGLSDAVGGDKHAIELLTAAMIAFKARGVWSLLGGVKTALVSLAGLRAAAELTAVRVGIALGIGSYGGVAAAGGVAALGAAGVGAVAWGFTHANNTSIPVPGKPGTQITRTSDGHFILTKGTAGRGGSATQRTPITAAQARALVPGAFTATGTGGPGDTMGRAPGGAAGGAASSRALIAQIAAKYKLDPQAVLGVASNEGLSGGIGDNGHAFGPFQLNNAGGVITGMFKGKTNAQIQAWAWSPAGIDWALRHMAASGAAGLTGTAAVNAIVTNFERPQNPAGDLAAGYKGVGSGGGGSSSAAIAALVAQGTTKPKKVHTISGLKLLPASMQLALDKAMGTKGLGDDTSALKHAIDFLKHDTSDGKLEVGKELGILQKNLNGVDKAIAAQVKAKHQALLTEIQKIKSSYSAKISADKAAIGTAFSQIQTDLDTAFQAQTQAYIDKVLGPKYSQGSMTTLEAQLAGMQTADQTKSLQDALGQAKKQLASDQNPASNLVEQIVDVATGKHTDIFSGAAQIAADQLKADQDAIDAAQRAIDENDLATQATAERAKADKDYAAAVTQYTADRTDLERQLNFSLADFGKRLQNGSVSIDQLGSVLVPFGVALSDVPTSQLSFDMDDLSNATSALAAVMRAEAQALAAVGSPDARAAFAAATRLTIPSNAPKLIPGTDINFAGFVTASALRNTIGMADGGILTHPTVIGGEAGREAIIPLESPRALSMIAGAIGGGDTYLHNVIQLDGRTVFESVQKHAKLSVNRGGSGVPS